MMHLGSVFDYQGSLFEATASLNSIAKALEPNKGHSCGEVKQFTGLSCFKHGAAFDKMGYYSVFMNVFCSLHYLGFIVNMDDSISLCMYFGLVCNGTSSLAVVWAELKREQDKALMYIQKKAFATRLFKVFVKLKVNKTTKKNDSVLHGNCKAPHFQYPNYANEIVTNRKLIHSTIKEFLRFRLGMKGS
jgi:hypothetical protein